MNIQFAPGHVVLVTINGMHCGVISASDKRITKSGGIDNLYGLIFQMYNDAFKEDITGQTVRSNQPYGIEFNTLNNAIWKGVIYDQHQTPDQRDYKILELQIIKRY